MLLREKYPILINALIKGSYHEIDEMYYLPYDNQISAYKVLLEEILKLRRNYCEIVEKLKKYSYKEYVKDIDIKIKRLDQYFSIHLEKVEQ